MAVDLTQPLILRRDPDKYILLLIVSLLFVAAAAYFIWSGSHFSKDKRVIGYISFIFFSICSIVFAIVLLSGASYLQFKQEGFIISVFFLQKLTKWADVDEFGVFQTRTSGLLVVGVKYKPNAQVGAKARRWNARHFGYEDALPDTYGMSAKHWRL